MDSKKKYYYGNYHETMSSRSDLHELKGDLKLLDGHHLDPEELHAHEQGDDGLDGLRGRLLAPAASNNTFIYQLLL